MGDNNNVLGQISDPAGPALLAASPAASIPTLDAWGLALLASLLGGSAGFMGLRRGAPGPFSQRRKG